MAPDPGSTSWVLGTQWQHIWHRCRCVAEGKLELDLEDPKTREQLLPLWCSLKLPPNSSPQAWSWADACPGTGT